MARSIFTLERAARDGAIEPAIAVMLDELESMGELGKRVVELRARVAAIARQRAAIWRQRPELAITDLYARTLDLPELVGARGRWIAELDARGPWLRALRPRPTDLSTLAELREGPALPLRRPLGLRFETEQVVGFALRPAKDDAVDQLRLSWRWTDGEVEKIEAVEALEPIPGRHRADPRLEHRGGDLFFRPSPGAEPQPVPWPEFGSPFGRVSADGQTLILGGWVDDYDGLIRLVDAGSLEILREHQLTQAVSEVIERPGSEELLVSTYRGLVILDRSGPIWSRSGVRADQLAWSPSGRYLCVVAEGVAQILDRQAARQDDGGGGGLPPSFSPDGARLVDGAALLDGLTGARVAELDVHLGNYLEGGPPSPWFHVGTELIVCIHGGLALWDSHTGAAIAPGQGLHLPHWERIAYSSTGRAYARGHAGEQSVTIHALPSTQALATVEFDLQVEQLALSPDGERVAAYGAGRFELRDHAGALRCAGQTPTQRPARHGGGSSSSSFSLDGRRLSYHEPASHGSRRTDAGEYVSFESPEERFVWDLETDPAGPATLLADQAANASALVLPPGWTLEPGPVSIFRHEDGGCLAVAHDGPWCSNPREPSILACPGAMFELRAHPRSLEGPDEP